MVGVALGKSAAEALDVANVGLLKVKARVPAKTAVAKDPQSLRTHLGVDAGWMMATARPATQISNQNVNKTQILFLSPACKLNPHQVQLFLFLHFLFLNE